MALLTLLATWAVAVVSPGPDFLAVLRVGASRGRRAGLLVGAGVVSGIACWATLALTGLSLLLARYAHLYVALRAIGAVFLLLYGLHILWSVWRDRGSSTDAADAPEVGVPSDGHACRLGLATNLANPKAVLFFGALFASVLPPHLSVLGKVGVVLVMLLMALTWFSGVAVLAGSQSVMRGYRRTQHTLDVAAGGLFTVAGAALIPR